MIEEIASMAACNYGLTSHSRAQWSVSTGTKSQPWLQTRSKGAQNKCSLLTWAIRMRPIVRPPTIVPNLPDTVGMGLL
jgi:hypothetical protein